MRVSRHFEGFLKCLADKFFEHGFELRGIGFVKPFEGDHFARDDIRTMLPHTLERECLI